MGGLGRGEACPSDLALDRFNCPSAGVFLTMGRSAAFWGSGLALLERAAGGGGALVILIFGFAAGSAFSGGIGVFEDEDTGDASVGGVLFGVEAPDSFSSRRRRICKV